MLASGAQCCKKDDNLETSVSILSGDGLVNISGILKVGASLATVSSNLRLANLFQR